MMDRVERTAARALGWHAITSIVMLVVGAACFILSCVAAMVVAGKD